MEISVKGLNVPQSEEKQTFGVGEGHMNLWFRYDPKLGPLWFGWVNAAQWARFEQDLEQLNEGSKDS